MGWLFLLFTAVPIAEIWVLLRVGRVLGAWPTIALLLATGAAGAWLAKHEGRRVLRGWQRAFAEGRVPEEGLLSGALVLVGAILLVSPGFVSDVLGLALLFPPSRRVAAVVLRRWAERKVAEGRIRVIRFGDAPRSDEPIEVTPPRRDGR